MLQFYADTINMKKIYIFLFIMSVSVLIPLQLLAQGADIVYQEGIASWYGREFEGRPTASGEIFDSRQLTAAHPTLPFDTMLVVTNKHNNRSVIVRVNDRGPYVPLRIIDVSTAAAEVLDMIVTGTAPVTIQVMSAASMSGHTELPAAQAESGVSDSSAARQTAVSSQSSTVYVSMPVITGAPSQQLRLSPEINIVPAKNYRLQVGSFTIARNAVEAFEKLQSSGLSPNYERFVSNDNIEYYRVVIAGVRGNDVQSTAERIRSAGFYEALIREEN